MRCVIYDVDLDLLQTKFEYSVPGLDLTIYFKDASQKRVVKKVDPTSTPITPRPIPQKALDLRKKRRQAMFDSVAFRQYDDESDSEIREVRKVLQ